MSKSPNQVSVSEETTYEQVNAKCREVSWPAKTAQILDCNVTPDSSEMNDDKLRDVAHRFWNQYLYPKYEDTYFKAFPADRAKMADLQSDQGLRPLDYNRKMILALCDWLGENGCFHYFDGRIVFIKHDAHALSVGDPLASGVPMNIYERDRIAFLLNGLLHRCIESRRKEKATMNWIVVLGITAALLAIILFKIVAT